MNRWTHKVEFHKGKRRRTSRGKITYVPDVRFRIVHRNGNIIAVSSEGYANITMARRSAERMIEAFKRGSFAY